MAGGSKTTRTEPWAEQKPYLQAGFKRAGELYEAAPRGPAYYGGPTVSGFDPATLRLKLCARFSTAGNATSGRS